jgi:hypothetical protein
MENEQPSLPSWLVANNSKLREDVKAEDLSAPSSSEDVVNTHSMIPLILKCAIGVCAIFIAVAIGMIVIVQNNREALADEWANLSREKNKLAADVDKVTVRQMLVSDIIDQEVTKRLEADRRKVLNECGKN